MAEKGQKRGKQILEICQFSGPEISGAQQNQKRNSLDFENTTLVEQYSKESSLDKFTVNQKITFTYIIYFLLIFLSNGHIYLSNAVVNCSKINSTYVSLFQDTSQMFSSHFSLLYVDKTAENGKNLGFFPSNAGYFYLATLTVFTVL